MGMLGCQLPGCKLLSEHTPRMHAQPFFMRAPFARPQSAHHRHSTHLKSCPLFAQASYELDNYMYSDERRTSGGRPLGEAAEHWQHQQPCTPSAGAAGRAAGAGPVAEAVSGALL